MKFSHRSIYGLRAILDLAYHGAQRPIQLREVAEREQIPVRFLEQIFIDFKQAGLVESKRGPKGGYVLAKKPEEMTVMSVFDAVSDAPSFDAPSTEPQEPQEEQGSVAGVADAMCQQFITSMRQRLEELTLAQMMQSAQELGVQRECYERFVYVI